MPTIKINDRIEYDFCDYVYGDTFDFLLDFYSDDNFLIPEDVSNYKFFFDIETLPNCGRSQPNLETLAINSGITLGPVSNEITISKILTSLPGDYNQSLRIIYPDGSVRTREKGTLKIDAKI